MEGNIKNLNFKEWNTMYESVWYVYGTFMGESITRDTKSDKAPIVRILIVVWIIYCFIMSQAYGGSLKSFLTSPMKSTSIETLKEVIKSIIILNTAPRSLNNAFRSLKVIYPGK